MDMKYVVKILLGLFEQGFSKEVIFSTVLTENTRQLSVMAKISHSQNEWRSDFWLLWLFIVRKLKL